MAEPVEADLAAVPPRLFTEEEASRLVPTLETIFLSLDPLLSRLRELRELVEDHEAYWGTHVEGPGHPEREAYLRILAEMASVRADVDARVQRIRDSGAEPKDLDLGLVDFYATVRGRISFLCWRRGEPKVAHWHSLEAGFAGRKPLADVRSSEP